MLLKKLRCRLALETTDAPQTALDNTMDILGDHSVLLATCKKLATMSKDKKMDILFHVHIVSMVGTLNLFLDPVPNYTWRKASLVSSIAQGHGTNHP